MIHSSRTLYIENNFTKREAYTRTTPFLAKKETCLIKASLLVEISGIEPLTSWMPFKRSPGQRTRLPLHNTITHNERCKSNKSTSLYRNHAEMSRPKRNCSTLIENLIFNSYPLNTSTRSISWHTIIFFVWMFRSVYKELHADHETGAADNK